MKKNHDEYKLVPFPKIRRGTIDVLRQGCMCSLAETQGVHQTAIEGKEGVHETCAYP